MLPVRIPIKEQLCLMRFLDSVYEIFFCDHRHAACNRRAFPIQCNNFPNGRGKCFCSRFVCLFVIYHTIMHAMYDTMYVLGTVHMGFSSKHVCV